MISQIRRLLTLLLLCVISITLLRSGLRHRVQDHHKYAAQHAQEPEKTVEHQSNATSFQHAGVLDEPWEGAPRLLQVSAQYGSKMDLLYERGLRSHVKYGERWGYPTHFLRQDIIGKGDFGDGMFNKLLYLQTIIVTELTKPFGKRAEWIAWFDADSIHLNHEIPWTIFLPPNEGELFRDINLLITKDWNGYNAGVFMIRVCEWSVNVLIDAIAIPRLRPEIEIPYRDQDAFKWVFNQGPNRRHRIYQPRHWWNNFDDMYFGGLGERVMNGTFQIHFPGMYGKRHDAMGKWLDRIDRHPEEFNIPLANTTYPQEVESYWSRLQSAAEMLQRTEEYKNELKEKEYDVFTSDQGRIPNRLGNAQTELHEIIQEEAYDKKRLREALLKLDSAVREAKKDAADASKRIKENQNRQQEGENKMKEDIEKEKQRLEKQKEELEKEKQQKVEEAERQQKLQEEREKSSGGGQDSKDASQTTGGGGSGGDGTQNTQNESSAQHQNAEHHDESTSLPPQPQSANNNADSQTPSQSRPQQPNPDSSPPSPDTSAMEAAEIQNPKLLEPPKSPTGDT